MTDQPRYTIQDAADALGLPLPGLSWTEGSEPSGELDRFVTDHSGHWVTATAHDGVRHVAHPDVHIRIMSLLCCACSEKLDAAVEESGWDEKIGHD